MEASSSLGDYLLVVGGTTTEWNKDTDHTEVISLYSDDYSVPSCMAYVAKFPEKAYEAIAGLVNNGKTASHV